MRFVWWKRVWNVIADRLVRWHIIGCIYCDNGTKIGCNCGAHGILEDGSGYAWCSLWNGCPRCGREEQ